MCVLRNISQVHYLEMCDFPHNQSPELKVNVLVCWVKISSETLVYVNTQPKNVTLFVTVSCDS